MTKWLAILGLVLVAALVGSCDNAETTDVVEFDPRENPQRDPVQVEASLERRAEPLAVAESDDDYVRVDTRSIDHVRLSDGSAGRVIRGEYQHYDYWYVEDPGGFYVVRFYPPLARNDEVVVGAFRELVSVLYGQDYAKTLDETPHLVARPEGKQIALYGVAYQYLFLPLKTDLGTVRSVFVRREAW